MHRTLDKIALWTGVPVGGVLLLILVVGGGFFVFVMGPVPQGDLLVGIIAWGVVYVIAWWVYGAEFWMDPKLLEVLKDVEAESGEENGD